MNKYVILTVLMMNKMLVNIIAFIVHTYSLSLCVLTISIGSELKILAQTSILSPSHTHTHIHIRACAYYILIHGFRPINRDFFIVTI